MSATPDSTLVNPEQLIADLHRQLAEREAELAECKAERDEALAQQTGTAEVLQVINASPGDLMPVFNEILEKATRICAAAFGILFTYDGESFDAVALQNVPAAFAADLEQPFRPSPGAALDRLLRGERFAHFPDVTVEDAYAVSQDARPQVELGGARSLLGVPLRKEGAFLGAFIVYRQEMRPFTDKQIALLESFAAQAVIAMENARLLTETREALEQQTATSEVLQVINASPGDIAPVFNAMLEKAVRLCEASHGNLYTYDGEFFRTVAVHGDERLIEWLNQIGPFRPIPGHPIAHLLDGGPFLHIADATKEETYRSHPIFREFIDKGGIRSSLIVAMRKDGATLGVITAYRQEVRPFSEKQIALLQNFAAQAVIAMENARLLGELRQRTDEVAELNRGLEAQVAEQVEELGRVGRLKRFLAPKLAELIVSQGDEKILESHRRDIVVVFCDLRGYTAFTETAEPEEGLDFLREYHGALGPLVSQYEGTLDHFSGDGIMVFFNDPVPCPDPAERAVKMAMAMREAASKLIAAWRRHGCELGFGIGIAQGYATLGQIGFSDRSGYTAIGTVCNLAARLCAEAKDAQILVSSRIAGAVESVVKLEDLGNLELKGFRRPVAAFNVVQSTSAPDARPNLTVVASVPEA
jgi:adenylate cyclase